MVVDSPVATLDLKKLKSFLLLLTSTTAKSLRKKRGSNRNFSDTTSFVVANKPPPENVKALPVPKLNILLLRAKNRFEYGHNGRNWRR